MPGLSGKLGDYIGIGMAAMMLGKDPEHTGPVYKMIRNNNIAVSKVGGVSFITRKDFDYVTGLHNAPSLWPDELANLDMSHIYGRRQLAAILGVAVGTVHYYATTGKVQRLDLSEWNMFSLYLYNNQKDNV